MNVFNQLNFYAIALFHLSQLKLTYYTDKSTWWIHLCADYVIWFLREWEKFLWFFSTKIVKPIWKTLSPWITKCATHDWKYLHLVLFDNAWYLSYFCDLHFSAEFPYILVCWFYILICWVILVCLSVYCLIKLTCYFSLSID